MGRERLTRGLALRLGALLAAACVCVHVLLEKGPWGGSLARAPAQPASSGRPTTSGLGIKTKLVSAEAKDRDRSVKRRVSYVRTLKKDGQTLKRGDDGPDPSPAHTRRKSPRWHIDLEPWASASHSLEDEAKRFLGYITTPQVSCASLEEGTMGAWAACLDPDYSLTHRIQSKHCRVYSFGLGTDDRSLESTLAGSGCEVHCFDPSLKQPHQQHRDMWLHRLSIDWRDPNPAAVAQRQHANTKKLATILNDFGHRQVDVLKADMESAEWKILENLVLEGVLDSVGQLLLELHLHWAGFEVGGDDPAVVRYWFSVLRELERAHFSLFRAHSDPARPHLFLHKNVLNASSAYTLGWVNTKWKP